MGKYFLILLLIITVGILHSCSKEKVDKYVYTLDSHLSQKSAQETLKGVTDSIDLMSLLSAGTDPYTRGQIQYFLAKKNYVDKQTDVALRWLNEAEINLTEDEESLGYICYYRSKIFYEQEKLDSAFQIALEGIKHFNSIDDSTGAAYLNILIANNFARNKNKETALDYYQKASELTKNSSNKKLITSLKFNTASLLTDIGETDQALAMFSTLLNSDNLSDSKKAKAHNNIAIIHLKQKFYNEALKHFEKAGELKLINNDLHGYTVGLGNIFSTYISMGDFESAEQIRNQLTPYVSLFNDNEKVEFLYNETRLKLKISNQKATEKLFVELYTLKDSLNKLAFSNKLIEIQKSFEISDRDQNIAFLKHREELKTAQLKRQKAITYFIFGFVLLFVAVGLIMNTQQKELKQSKDKLEEQKGEIYTINQQLHLSNQAKDRLLSIIGHDLRGPIGGLKELISLYMELPGYEEKDFKDLLEVGYKASTGAYHLLDNLLTWANSQRGEIEFNPVGVPLLPLIKKSVQLLDGSINKNDIKFEYHIPAGLKVTTDINMLQTILRNLLSNAIKYSNANTSITISSSQNKSETTISITDEGQGMGGKELSQLFEKKETFFIDSGYLSKGTGLGLILCKEFVEQHNGRIWADSKQGKGTTVYFTIPIELSQQKTEEEKPNLASMIGQEKFN